MYALGLVGHCIVEINQPGFLCPARYRTPVFVGVAAMSLNLILSILFQPLFI
jgi:putative peptidoglycan lipid II flippase